MKLVKVEIANFRGIEHLELDDVFRDDLGRIRNRIPIVGPNTSGKTAILDAISLCLMPVAELGKIRDGLPVTSPSLVRRGAVRAEVTCTVRFADDELRAIRDSNDRVGNPYGPIPQVNEVAVHWRFPVLDKKYPRGRYDCKPTDGWKLFKARKTVARFLHAPGISPHDFESCGGVFLFDQKRTGLAQKITESDRELLGHGDESQSLETPQRSGDPDDYTTDPREILLTLASRAQAPQDPEATQKEDYEQLCALYARVCRPHRIRGLYNTEHGLDMEFESEQGLYHFSGLSSGQEMLLLLLLHFARYHIHRSIVLIDELELHLHPLWQSRLYESLTELGIDNQFLFTTHSTHLRDSMHDECYQTGDLGETAVVG